VLNLLQGLAPVRANDVPDVPDVPDVADAVAIYWDPLFGAVCDRLAALAEQSTEPAIKAGLSECLVALAQLRQARVKA
jgi:hypothetical protein